ncbi:MAG: spore coat protein [Acetobacteraceae bacterium]|nr:spore coat protein [Acetobacteraceae bacterium]
MSDKVMMADCLLSQKHMGELYNSFLIESGTQELRRDLMDIHRQEIDNTFRIFQAMTSRGWYRTVPADQQTLAQIKSEMQASPGGGQAEG